MQQPGDVLCRAVAVCLAAVVVADRAGFPSAAWQAGLGPKERWWQRPIRFGRRAVRQSVLSIEKLLLRKKIIKPKHYRKPPLSPAIAVTPLGRGLRHHGSEAWAA